MYKTKAARCADDGGRGQHGIVSQVVNNIELEVIALGCSAVSNQETR